MEYRKVITFIILVVCVKFCQSHLSLLENRNSRHSSENNKDKVDLLKEAIYNLKPPPQPNYSQLSKVDAINLNDLTLDASSKHEHDLHKEGRTGPKRTRRKKQEETFERNPFDSDEQQGRRSTSGSRDDPTSQKRRHDELNTDTLADNGLNESHNDVDKTKRKNSNGQKKDAHMLSNPTYQFFMIAILVFSGVGVFIAVSVAVVYLVKKIKDDGNRRDTIEMDDKSQIGLYYYQDSDSTYSDMGSTFTSHSHLSDEGHRYGAAASLASPLSEDDDTLYSRSTARRVVNYNNGYIPKQQQQQQQYPPNQYTSCTTTTLTTVQPGTTYADIDQGQYGTFYRSNNNSSNNRPSSADDNIRGTYSHRNYPDEPRCSAVSQSDDTQGLLTVSKDNKRPRSF